MAAIDLQRLRRDFPILDQEVHGRPLAYLDNAATSQKPRVVMEAMDHYYRCDNANVHRGVHTLGERATQAFEAARETVRRFVNAAATREIVFLRGTTEAINLVANSFCHDIAAGEEIIISAMEHHANIVPWQMLCQRSGAVLKVIPMNRQGELDLEAFERLLGPRTRLVSVVHVSNVLGTVNPVQAIIERAHARDVPVLVDGAQATPHMPVDVQALDADFYAFSGHKQFGPTGIGALYGKEKWLDAMPPWQGGGDMIRSVSFEHTTYSDLPYKFEAGTPDIAGAVGLHAAIDYLQAQDQAVLHAWETELLAYASRQLKTVPGLRIIGEAGHKASVISFVVDKVHPHDLGTILDHHGIAVRAGHHCAMPVMAFYGIPATTRASMAFYNTREEIDRLVEALNYAREVLI